MLGLDFKSLKETEYLLTSMSILSERLLLESTEAKLNITNLLAWLNKCVIKTVQENEIEIENSKSYLIKYSIDTDRLHKMLENQDLFQMKNLISFFTEIETIADPQNFDNLALKTNEISEEEIIIRNSYSKLSYEQSLREIKNLKEFFNIKYSEEKKINLMERQFNFRREKEKGNFFDIFKKVEMKWNEIVKKPQESISGAFTTNFIIKLGSYEMKNEIIINTPQELIKDALKIGFYNEGKFNIIEVCIKEKKLRGSIIPILPNFELREACFGKNEELLLLFSQNSNKNPKNSFLLTSAGVNLQNSISHDFSSDFQDFSKQIKDMMSTSLEIKKTFQLEGNSAAKLKGSLRGLIALIIEENKLMIFEDS